ncbi:histidine kinase [Nocardiopsis aegyptia]|uniref:histidine kinase n=1 Tax=Nocardiopsis aegyptia TaxID=220378 RepID=UPI00366AD126
MTGASTPTPGATMADPSAFGTALWTVAIVAAFVLALSLAALSDMAMRRREDRAADRERRPEPPRDGLRRGRPGEAGPTGGNGTRWG